MTAQGPATPSALYKMISIPEAQKIVLAETACLPSVSVALTEAVGCILSEDVQAPENVPPFPASIKVETLKFLHQVTYRSCTYIGVCTALGCLNSPTWRRIGML